MEKPFIYGKLAIGSDFTDRKMEVSRLRQNFQSGVNTILISPRRWGKTSLVYRVAKGVKQSNKDIRFCFLDLYNIRTEQEFYEQYARVLIEASAGKWEERIKNAGDFFKKLIPKFSFSPDANSEFSLKLEWEEVKKFGAEILDLPETIYKKKGWRFVICIDEFQNISHYDDPKGFQKKLRSNWQKHAHTTYCLYGSQRHMLMEFFSNPSMPFYRFGDIVFLDRISKKDWVIFIVKRFKDSGKVITKEQSEIIIDAVERHSYYVQQYAQAVWFRTEKKCDDKTISETLETLLDQHSILYLREIDQLSNSQINLLHALCDNVQALSGAATLRTYRLNSSALVTKSKRALEKKEIIDTAGEELLFIDPLFKLWLKRRYFTNHKPV